MANRLRCQIKDDKLIRKITGGTSDANIAFIDIKKLLIQMGFEVRIKGSHHVFRKNGVRELINLQQDGNKAKPYQVKQVRDLIIKYKLGGRDDV